MKIIVTDLNGNQVDVINTNASTLDSDIETVKSKYPVGKFHATLQTY